MMTPFDLSPWDSENPTGSDKRTTGESKPFALERDEVNPGRFWLGENPDFAALDQALAALDAYGCRISLVGSARWADGPAYWEHLPRALALAKGAPAKTGQQAKLLRREHGGRGYVLDFFVNFLSFEIVEYALREAGLRPPSWMGGARAQTSDVTAAFEFLLAHVASNEDSRGVKMSVYRECFDVADPAFANAFRLLRWAGSSNVELVFRSDPNPGKDALPLAAVNRGSGAFDAQAELDAMIGLEGVKTELAKALALLEASKAGAHASFHMAFMGAPGTGKSQAARIVAQLLAEKRGNGRDVHFVEATRADLVGQYVGETPIKARKLFDRARGGVLFIDEAYALASDTSRTWDYGLEAITELVAFMEAERSNTVVILAGYTDPMQILLDSNEGLRSRVRIQVEFDSYTPGELAEIATIQADAMGLALSDEAREELAAFLAYAHARGATANANGRFVRNLLEEAYAQRALALVAGEEDTGLVSFEHISAAIASRSVQASLRSRGGGKRIGFASEQSHSPKYQYRTRKPDSK